MFTTEEIEIYDSVFNKYMILKNQKITNNTEWKPIKIDDIHMDDHICISYIPNSQKYLYTHTPEIGIVIKINKINITDPNDYNNEKDQVINDIIIKNADNEEISIYKEGLCYYSRGYDMFIDKLFNINTNNCCKKRSFDDYYGSSMIVNNKISNINTML